MPISIARAVCTLLFALALAACAETKGPFRTTPLTDPVCAEVQDLQARNQEIGKETLRRCALQMHFLPGASDARRDSAEAAASAPEGTVVLPRNDWTVMAAEAQRVLQHSDDYTLAFVELGDRGENEVPWQMPALTSHLEAQRKAGRQNYVVAFVHGWRHNAQLRDGDIRKLRRMLAYSRAALNTRCVQLGEYCNAALTGVFIGWNGQRLREGPSDDNPDQGMGTGLASIGPALTFWDRWNVSCRLGSGKSDCQGRPPKGFKSPLRKVLRGVEKELRLKQGDPRRDKFLIFGHSMGGNMLASMLRDEAERKVDRHAPGTVMAPLMGDLVVLLNPAARSVDWTAIQKAERRRAGFKGSNRLTCQQVAGNEEACTERERQALMRWHRLYPLSQRPVYVSLTSAADWGTLKQKDRAVDHDTATGDIFPFAREFVGEDGLGKVVAIGHRTPNYASRFAVHGNAVGTSHEVAVLEGAQTDDGRRFASRYGNAVTAEAGWCEPADGWLLRARQPAGVAPGQYATNWDYGLARAPDGTAISSRNVGGAQNKAAVQWRQGMYLKTHTGALSVSPGTSPFWNVRALDSAIRGHAAWANYATWCALNQLVLDDVTVADPETLPPGEAVALLMAPEGQAGE